VLKRGRGGERWRTERWDSLAFQFPNWALTCPDSITTAPDPDGFTHYTDVLARIEQYAQLQAAPVREHTEVLSLAPASTTDSTTPK